MHKMQPLDMSTRVQAADMLSCAVLLTSWGNSLPCICTLFAALEKTNISDSNAIVQPAPAFSVSASVDF